MNKLYKKFLLSILVIGTPIILSGCFPRISLTCSLTFELSTLDGTQIEKQRADGRMPSEVVADELEQRLLSYGLSGVESSCPRYDEVVVKYKQKDSSLNKDIKKILMHSGRLALSTKLDDFLVNEVPDERFLFEDAYVSNDSVYPLIKVPVRGAFNNLLEIAKQYRDDGIYEAAELEDNGDCGALMHNYYLYLWSDYKDGDTFEEQDKNEGKIIAKFDINQVDESSSLVSIMSTYLGNYDANNDGKYSKKEQKAAVNAANLCVGLINTNPLEYNLKCITTIYAASI